MSDKPVWLIRWDGPQAPSDDVALILPGTHTTEEVREIVQALYLHRSSTPTEMLGYATGIDNPYPAELHRLTDGGESIVCGHDPFLEARRVAGARVASNNKVEWEEGT